MKENIFIDFVNMTGIARKIYTQVTSMWYKETSHIEKKKLLLPSSGIL